MSIGLTKKMPYDAAWRFAGFDSSYTFIQDLYESYSLKLYL
jgi:hypothetical protein